MGRRPRRSPPRLWDDEVQSALAEVEALYNFSPLGLCVLDRDLRYRRINRRLAEINGLPAADHLGRTVKDVLPQFAEPAGAWARRVFRTGKPVFNVELAGETPAQPGKRRFWREHWLPLRDRRRRIAGVAVIVEESTAQKRAEAALREREEMFHALTDGITELLTIVDAQGRVLYESPNMTRVLGYRAGELMGRRIFDFVHPDDLSRARIVFRKLLADRGGALRIEVRVRAKRLRQNNFTLRLGQSSSSIPDWRCGR
jgi:PAS domain S-box-containing protein